MSQQLPHARDKSGYLAEDTIAAIATATGGAIAVIRISGPAAFRALESLAGRSSSNSEARKLCRARLQNGHDEWLDDALYVKFVAPESYTGENMVELHIHGGGFIASKVMEALARLGVRQALPGEFSFRAVRNGKMSLSQATAVADLISATNPEAVRLALEKMSGAQNLLLSGLADDLKKLAVLGEIGIDFSDQDVDEVSLPNLKKRLTSSLVALRKLHGSYQRGFRLQDGVSVAFVGLPNAGKSSFFNALLGEDRSIVSDIPGTTRDVIRERLTLAGKNKTVTLRLEDTAGLRISQDHVERIGIERSRKSAKDADLILLVVDPTQPTSDIQEEWDSVQRPSPRTIAILSKADLTSSERLSEVRKELSGLGIKQSVAISSVTGDGITEAVEVITEYCGQWTSREKGEVLLTRLDQVDAVAAAMEHLSRAQDAPEIDLFASDIRQALFALEPLIGMTAPDDILGQIFTEFCIGK